MDKKTRNTVRSHMQERQWLLNLGDGNIVNGVRQLIQEEEKNRQQGRYSRRRPRRW